MSSGPPSLLSNYYFVRNGLRFQTEYFPRHRLRFVWNFLIRVAPGMCLKGQIAPLLFRVFGAAGFVFGHSGRAPSRVERLAGRLAKTSRAAGRDSR